MSKGSPSLQEIGQAAADGVWWWLRDADSGVGSGCLRGDTTFVP